MLVKQKQLCAVYPVVWPIDTVKQCANGTLLHLIMAARHLNKDIKLALADKVLRLGCDASIKTMGGRTASWLCPEADLESKILHLDVIGAIDSHGEASKARWRETVTTTIKVVMDGTDLLTDLGTWWTSVWLKQALLPQWFVVVYTIMAIVAVPTSILVIGLRLFGLRQLWGSAKLVRTSKHSYKKEKLTLITLFMEDVPFLLATFYLIANFNVDPVSNSNTLALLSLVTSVYSAGYKSASIKRAYELKQRVKVEEDSEKRNLLANMFVDSANTGVNVKAHRTHVERSQAKPRDNPRQRSGPNGISEMSTVGELYELPEQLPADESTEPTK